MAKSDWSRDWSVGVRVWIERRGQAVLGEGRAELLEAIGERRSITAAAKAVGVSYRKAWNVVQEVNEAAGTPLVEAAVGGVQGGGARLTERGRMAVDVYRQLLRTLEASAAGAIGQLVADGSAGDAPCVHLAAAISLQEALGQILSAFALRRPTVRVRAVYGPSNELASHALAGAACSLFISAEGREVDRLAAAGKAARGTRRVIARNGLAAIGAEGGVQATSLRKLVDRVAKIALADPACPLGRYTQTYLEAAGVHERLLPRAMLLDSSRAVVAAVESGAAEAGIVFASDAAAAQLRAAVPCAAIEGLGRVCGDARGREGRRSARFARLLVLADSGALPAELRISAAPQAAIAGEGAMSAALRFALAPVVATIAVGAACATLRAATIVVGASHDASIFASNPDHASGAGNGLFAGTNGTGSPRRALVEFDLSSIPAGSVVQSVELTLHLGQFAGMGGGGGGATTSTIGLHRATAAWGEGETQKSVPPTDSFAQIGQGADALDGDATWDARFYSANAPQLWDEPGGDFVAHASASLAVSRTVDAAYVWSSTPTLVSDVNTWLAEPAVNHGWLLVHDDESLAASFRGFYSRDVATAAYHPRLTVVYEPGPTADFDGDRDVDGADLLIWQRGLGVSSGATRADGDATGDGAVTGLDLQVWAQHFSGAPANARAVPEPPAALAAALLSAGALAGTRKRRFRRQ